MEVLADVFTINDLRRAALQNERTLYKPGFSPEGDADAFDGESQLAVVVRHRQVVHLHVNDKVLRSRGVVAEVRAVRRCDLLTHLHVKKLRIQPNLQDSKDEGDYVGLHGIEKF